MKKVLGAIVLLASGLGVCEPVEAARFSGRLPRMTAVTKDDGITFIAALQWKTVPGMSVDVTTTKDGPVVATFCATGSSSTGLTLVRVRVPGIGNLEPGHVTFNGDTMTFRARCFSWFGTLPAGTYRIRVQWYDVDANSSNLQNRSFIVQHEN